MPKYLRVSWKTYGSMAMSLVKKIKKSGQKFDLVIGVARGGIPLALVIADQIGCKIDIINVKSYTGLRGQRVAPKILTTLDADVKGLRLLIVDDLIEEGATMELMRDYFKAKRPKLVKTAVFYIKPWSKFKPNYWLRLVDRWVVFPWESGEFSRIKK
jgi:uncharacterized protein